jgi:hypothetical protein
VSFYWVEFLKMCLAQGSLPQYQAITAQNLTRRQAQKLLPQLLNHPSKTRNVPQRRAFQLMNHSLLSTSHVHKIHVAVLAPRHRALELRGQCYFVVSFLLDSKDNK